jgi:hypothetical protein
LFEALESAVESIRCLAGQLFDRVGNVDDALVYEQDDLWESAEVSQSCFGVRCS